MCSIFGVFDIKTDAAELRKKALELSRLMRIAARTGPASTLAITRFSHMNACRLLMLTPAPSPCITPGKPTCWR